MSKQKLLTLCIPTYNRGVHLEEQLKRLVLMPTDLWHDLTVFVSDNCSSDDTGKIVEKYRDCPFSDIQYSCNNTNIGMDGNFVKCFKHATTNYVWLLGDDDYIILERLPFILNILKNGTYGLIHLGINRDENIPYRIIDNAELFIKNIGIWITYISSNIVNTKYVEKIQFENYYGTFLTLCPLYLTAALGEKENVMINTRIFENGKDIKRNGGYNYIEVFANNYLQIFKELESKGRISSSLFQFEKHESFSFVLPKLVDLVILKRKSNFSTKGTWRIMFQNFGTFKTLTAVLYNIVSRIYKRIK